MFARPMFAPSANPRLLAEPPGADFPAAVVRGLRARMADHPPQAMARVTILANSGGMLRRLRAALIGDGEPGFLPRLRLVTAPGEAAMLAPPPASPLRRHLELAQLVRRLIDSEPDVAPRAAAFALAESLATLLDEMQAEGVPFDALDRLDVSDHSAHWARSLGFLRLVTGYLGADAAPDTQRRQRMAVEAQIARWQATPPADPVLVVGSTGSRSATAMLMQAVARLPQGAVVLPGFDFDMPQLVWDRLDDPLQGEDHPQFRLAALIRALGVAPGDVDRWSDSPAPDSGRAALISLALRPAPVTDQWRAEGAGLGALPAATVNLTLIEAPTPRAEAMAIALILRDAAATGQRAALITPDRALARQVSAALDRWHIRPDDSAGRPLGLSAAGRFLRHVAQALAGPLTAEALVILLKHPITHSATDRGPHLLLTRALELTLRRRGTLYPAPADLARWAGDDPARQAWAGWLAPLLTADMAAETPLADWLTRHRALAEALARGPSGAGTGALWEEPAGEAALTLMAELQDQAAAGGVLSHLDYTALIDRLLAGQALRDGAAAHPLVSIHGIREAREVAAEITVLAGLNEGTWPAMPTPDPWLNRQMRLQAGLLLPERQIGLAAHDFQQAACAPGVVLTRARRDAEAETVPARWLNRLTNLIAGLPDQQGPEALAAMRARGRHWLDTARAFEADHSTLPPAVKTPSPRPAPAPPASARPRQLRVTAVKTLIRDPYQIYAEAVLGLRVLDPLSPQPDARLRGIVLHRLFDAYVRAHPPGQPPAPDALLTMAADMLEQDIPAPATRHFWRARLARVAEDFARWNAEQPGTPALAEKTGTWTLSQPAFTLTGKPDRIDTLPDGSLYIADYKTGTPPTAKQQEHFDKQLILLALMAEDGAFPGLYPAPVTGAGFVGVGSSFKTVAAPVSEGDLAEHRGKLATLLARYLRPAQGFTARRAMKEDKDSSPYDALSRLGEWELTDDAVTIRVGNHD